MRIVGLDIGERRVGVAFCDTDSSVCVPLRVMPAQEVYGNSRTWRMVLEDNEAELLVCGMPRTLSGAQGSQAGRVRRFAEHVAQNAGLPLEFADERLSSAEARRYLREQGLSERDMRGKVDSVAASLILQTWVDSRA